MFLPFLLFGIDDAIIIPALIAAGSAIVGSIVNHNSQTKTNQSNQAINETNLDWAKYSTQEQWERDDNAHQREVRDLEAAGLSPLANTTGSPVTSANTPTGMLAMQAPQFDMNNVVQALSSMSNATLRDKELEETIRNNKANNKYRDTELKIDAEKTRILSEQLNLENKKVQEQIRYQTELNSLEANRLEEVVRSNKKNESLTLSAQESLEIERESKRYYEEITKQSGGSDIPYQEVNDFDAYIRLKELYDIQLRHFIEQIGATQSASASSKSDSYGAGLGLGGSVAGTGLNGSVNGNFSNSASQYNMENLSDKQKAMWYKFQQSHKVPVYIDKSKYKYHGQGKY